MKVKIKQLMELHETAPTQQEADKIWAEIEAHDAEIDLLLLDFATFNDAVQSSAEDNAGLSMKESGFEHPGDWKNSVEFMRVAVGSAEIITDYSEA